MSRRGRCAIALAALAVAPAVTGAGADAAPAPAPVSVTVDRALISTQLGRKFVLRSTVTNRGARPIGGLIAHLNVLSLRDGVYVDPEDWSSHRTSYLGTIAPGASRTTTWRLEAVNVGRFGVYVAILDRRAARAPTTARTTRIVVAQRRTLNSGGILPLALGVPALVALLALGLRLRRGG